MAERSYAFIVHSSLHDPVFVRTVEEKVERAVGQDLVIKRYYSADQPVPSDVGSAVIVIATGGTESLLLKLTSQLKNKPKVFLTYDIANSLPAFMEAYPLLKQEAASMTYITASFDNLEQYLLKARRILSALSKIRGSRLGLIGGISEWLVYSKTSLSVVKEKLGISMVELPIERVYELYSQVQNAEKSEELNQIISSSKLEVPKEEVEKAYRLYIALSKLAKSEKLDGFTIKCFDIIKQLRTTACLAVSLFNSKLVTAGCEGDIPSFLSMHVLTALTGKPAFMGNPSKITNNRFLIAHCTAPLAISASKPILKTHFESNMGVGVAITFDRGEATFLRLSPDLSSARLFKGKIVMGDPVSDKHCRSQAWVQVNFDPRVLIERSMGNHYVFVEGDHLEELMGLLNLLGVNVELL
jgi:L-fucose isomerase-like protein